jgi:hypothetical protein
MGRLVALIGLVAAGLSCGDGVGSPLRIALPTCGAHECATTTAGGAIMCMALPEESVPPQCCGPARFESVPKCGPGECLAFDSIGGLTCTVP